MAHANVINMALQNRPIARAPGPINALAAALVGLLVTWWTARRGPLARVVAMLLTAGALVSIGAMTFHLTGYHLSSFPAAAGAALVWACVAVLRQFTEERARREFQRALSQYTSPAVASRIAHRARTDDLSPRPAVVTCFFSDLQGFTPLSEKLGAARTRELLNPYLEEMSRVLVAHNAIINKFIGDGIFAFFNAPVLPCADHARASCRCALASIAALDELNALRIDDGSVPPLIMRIGLSTGEVFVGDYGSSAKLDFTCIGDTVNVGARLEAANKALGTAVLVDQTTHDAAGAEFAFRYVGRLLLPGKVRPVEAHELSGAMGDRTPVDAEFIARFEQAVRHFQMCEWDLCREDLARCQSLKPDDAATALYLRAVDEAKGRAQTDRSGAITITAM
jgi:adenylate cyclase